MEMSQLRYYLYMATESLADAIRQTAAVIDRRIDAELRQSCDMTLSQYLFLRQVRYLENSDARSLAKALGVSPPAISQRLGWFEQRNLVAVERHGPANRLLRIRITPAGVSLLDRASRAADVTAERLVSSVHAPLREALASTLHRIIASTE